MIAGVTFLIKNFNLEHLQTIQFQVFCFFHKIYRTVNYTFLLSFDTVFTFSLIKSDREIKYWLNKLFIIVFS